MSMCRCEECVDAEIRQLKAEMESVRTRNRELIRANASRVGEILRLQDQVKTLAQEVCDLIVELKSK